MCVSRTVFLVVLSGLMLPAVSYADDAPDPGSTVGTWAFDLVNYTTAIPVGFGVGKVWAFGFGSTVNAFVEP
jgi:hypothetical protein